MLCPRCLAQRGQQFGCVSTAHLVGFGLVEQFDHRFPLVEEYPDIPFQLTQDRAPFPKPTGPVPFPSSLARRALAGSKFRLTAGLFPGFRLRKQALSMHQYSLIFTLSQQQAQQN